jgi:hypothetical protein
MPSRKEENTENNQMTRQKNDFDHLIKLDGSPKDDEATNAINQFFIFFIIYQSTALPLKPNNYYKKPLENNK